ncbi:MAG TPA: PIN domain-containing protein [Epsilonproteobacteria bacterium]|nr:PIN domain-containing protein [Campylobacterota bacterium]HHD73210.1 PIN domain-containing protein [Campylobacterota bacterium]
MTKIFLDTNFFLDILDSSRKRHQQAQKCLNYFLNDSIKLYTSSDIISTVSYFLQKNLTMSEVIRNIDFIVQEITVLSGNNDDFIMLNQLIASKLEERSLNIDYEDCMQLYLADKYECDTMLTSDKRFCQGIDELFDVKIYGLDACELF